MIELLSGDIHELTARIAYERWERRGCHCGLLKLIGSQQENDLAALDIRADQTFSLFGVSLEPNEERTV